VAAISSHTQDGFGQRLDCPAASPRCAFPRKRSSRKFLSLTLARAASVAGPAIDGALNGAHVRTRAATAVSLSDARYLHRWTWRTWRVSNTAHEASRATTTLGDLQRATVAMAELRAMPALRAAGVRCRRHPLGPRRVERRLAAARALYRVRTRGCYPSASQLGRCRRRLSTVSS
jgi:hypothetical protein